MRDQAAIFDRFLRAHEHLDAKLGVSGSGRGLSIVVDCVNTMNGTIRCESEEGRGTELLIVLREVAPPPPAVPE